MANYLVFLTASLLLLAVPGPAVLFIISRSADRGSKAGVASVGGIAAAGFVHVLLAVFGLSAIVKLSPLAFASFRHIGAAYLIFLGLAKFWEGKSVHSAAPLKPRRLKTIFAQGFFIQLLNPKVSLFFLSFLPQFVDMRRGSAPLQILIFGLTFLSLAFATDTLYAVLAGRLTAHFSRRADLPALGKWLSGGLYILLGAGAEFLNWH